MKFTKKDTRHESRQCCKPFQKIGVGVTSDTLSNLKRKTNGYFFLSSGHAFKLFKNNK